MDGRCVPRRERQLSLVKVELRVLCMPMRDLCCHLGFRLGEKKTKTKQNMMTVQLLVWGKRILCSFLPCTLWHILLCLYWRIAFVSQFNDGTSNPRSLVKQWAQKPFGIRYLPLSMHIYAFWAIAVVTLWHRNCLVNMIADNQWWMHSGGFGKKKKKTVLWCNGVEIAFQTRYYSITMNQALKVPLLGPHHRDLRLHIILCLFLFLSLTASLSFPVIHIIPLSVFEYWI